jgi:hypothetical protein
MLRASVRQLLAKLGGGHRTVVGTPEQIADAITEWWNYGAAHGFNFMAPLLPSGLEAFVDEVVPILQKRMLFRLEYTGKTLRKNYGLSPSKSVQRPQPSAARPANASRAGV